MWKLTTIKTQINPIYRMGQAAYATEAELTAGRKYRGQGFDLKTFPPKLYPCLHSLQSRGFLRNQKAYKPPEDLETRLDSVFERVVGQVEDSHQLNDWKQRTQLFLACNKEFQHEVTNSCLHTINTLGDLRHYYRLEVNRTTPMEKLSTQKLPANLHIQHSYNRWHPDTDTRFGGQTVFNRRSTIVTGLKYKNKYPGHIQNPIWPFNS